MPQSWLPMPMICYWAGELGRRRKESKKEEHDTEKQKVCGAGERGRGDPGTPGQSTSAGLLSPTEGLPRSAHVTAKAPVSPAAPKSQFPPAAPCTGTGRNRAPRPNRLSATGGGGRTGKRGTAAQGWGQQPRGWLIVGRGTADVSPWDGDVVRALGWGARGGRAGVAGGTSPAPAPPARAAPARSADRTQSHGQLGLQGAPSCLLGKRQAWR